MLSSERSGGVRWGPVGSDWVRCGSIGSGGVISRTVYCLAIGRDTGDVGLMNDDN